MHRDTTVNAATYRNQPCATFFPLADPFCRPRNERFRGAAIEGGLDDAFFANKLKDKLPGVLEFDYVSTTRIPAEMKFIRTDEVNMILRESGLKPLRDDPKPFGFHDLMTTIMGKQRDKPKQKLMRALLKEAQLKSQKLRLLAAVSEGRYMHR